MLVGHNFKLISFLCRIWQTKVTGSSPPPLWGSVVIDKVYTKTPKMYAVLVSKNLQSGWLMLRTYCVELVQREGPIWADGKLHRSGAPSWSGVLKDE